MRDTFPHIKTRMAWLLNARLQVLVPCCLALLALLLAGGISLELAAALDVPPYRGYVNDYGAMMSPALELKLEQALQSFDLNDSTQIAILTIDTLAGDALEDFSIRVVEQWKIGQRGKDNGVLFLAVKKDRKLRIEVGRGLEHVLTDLAAGRIIDSVVAPRFKAGRFDEGFETGINAIIQATKGEYGAGGRDQGQRRSARGRCRASSDAYASVCPWSASWAALPESLASRPGPCCCRFWFSSAGRPSQPCRPPSA